MLSVKYIPRTKQNVIIYCNEEVYLHILKEFDNEHTSCMLVFKITKENERGWSKCRLTHLLQTKCSIRFMTINFMIENPSYENSHAILIIRNQLCRFIP